jgi:hypothetical protein
MTDLPQTQPLPAPDQETIRARQRSRAIVMAWLLGGFVILVFAISIVKIQLGLG